MLPKYRRVTLDRLANLTTTIEGREFASGQDEHAVLVKRELHTVKGEARLMGLKEVSHLAHEVESLFILALETRTCAEHRDRLVEGLDYIGKLVEAPDPFAPPDGGRLDEILRELASLTGSESSASGLDPPPRPPSPSSPPSPPEPAPAPSPPPAALSPRRARLVDKLRLSAEKRSTAIVDHLRAFDAESPDADADQSLQREIHTLKGDTRIVGFDVASRVAARVETIIKELVVSRKLEALRPDVTRGLLLIEQLLNLDGATPEAIQREVDDFLSSEAKAGGKAPRAEPAGAGVAEPSESLEEVSAEAGPFLAEETGAVVTVGASHLMALTDVAGELLVRHEQVDRSIADMDRITSTMSRDLARALTSGMDAAVGHAVSRRRDLLPRMNALSKELLSTVARAREELFESRLYLGALQGEIREVRMVRVGELFDRHARSLRELARDQGKRVRVQIWGTTVTVDKQVLDHLDEPLLHLMRNAVDHALESPSERRQRGKSERGTLELGAREVGSFVEISVRDDGRGVDPERVKATAVRRGVISAEAADGLDDERVLSLIFEPGFSTREEANEMSGRGVGLDVVSTQLSELGGVASVESRLGEGTSFCLRCPISVAFARCLVLKVAEELYALPSASVVEVLRVEPDEVEDKGGGRAIHYQGKRIPLVTLASLLGVSSGSSRGSAKTVVLRGDDLLAIDVDAVVGEREVVRKSLNAFLAGVSMITGTATVEERRLVMFIHMPELFRAVNGSRAASSPARASGSVAVARRHRVLVVDDSELTRDMLVPLLERLRYEVSEAVDGADALSVLGKSRPDLMLTDLDMPVMDGFALVERVRANSVTMDMPVIVFSTRGSDEDKRRAMEAGANAYLVKSAFRAEELDRVIRRHLHDEGGR